MKVKGKKAPKVKVEMPLEQESKHTFHSTLSRTHKSPDVASMKAGEKLVVCCAQSVSKKNNVNLSF